MTAKDNLNKSQFVDLFHGTDAESAENIRQEGLHPAEGRADVHTVAYDKKSAEEYAHDKVDWGGGGTPAVVHMRVPDDEWANKYAGDIQDHSYSRAAGLRETIPPKYIKKVTHPKPQQRSGFYE
jgi:hypothetical protein